MIVLVHKRGAVVSGFGTPATVARHRGFVKVVVLPPSVKIGMAAVMAKRVKGVHPSGEMVVAVLVQPAYVGVFLVARWPGSSSCGGRRRKVRPELAGRG
jgi:hypothetical protein